MTRGSHSRLGVVVALAVCSPLTTTLACREEPFLERIVECEDALARLDACCPGFDSRRLECTHRVTNERGCGETSSRVAFAEVESECILATSCERLVATGVCARAQTAHDETPDAALSSAKTSEPGVAKRPAVCP